MQEESNEYRYKLDITRCIDKKLVNNTKLENICLSVIVPSIKEKKTLWEKAVLNGEINKRFEYLTLSDIIFKSWEYIVTHHRQMQYGVDSNVAKVLIQLESPALQRSWSLMSYQYDEYLRTF